MKQSNTGGTSKRQATPSFELLSNQVKLQPFNYSLGNNIETILKRGASSVVHLPKKTETSRFENLKSRQQNTELMQTSKIFIET